MEKSIKLFFYFFYYPTLIQISKKYFLFLFRKVEILIDSKVISTGYGSNIKDARTLAFEEAFNLLKENCYTIKLALNSDHINIVKDAKNTQTSEEEEDVHNIYSTNKGFQMMKKLGWSGGSLGLKNKGIGNPVK